MEYEKTNNNLFDDSKSKNISKERILLEWTNINYSIVTKKKKKKIHPIDNENLLGQPVIENEQNGEINQPTDIINDPDTKLILRNIQGFAAPYELLAIMGPSGSGKTSLLNIIAHRQLPTGAEHLITREVKLRTYNRLKLIIF